MDIHRCRFVPYPPSTINALAFSHPSSASGVGKGPTTLRLAVGRANGDVEIWNPLKGAWFHETTLRGGKDRSIEGLVWTQDPDEHEGTGFIKSGKLRLFSIGYSTAVTEWDLEMGRPVRHSGGNYGEVWCMAAQTRWQSQPKNAKVGATQLDQGGEFRGQHIAVGCADGAIILLSTADGDLQFQRVLSRPSSKKARVLSVDFQHRNIVVAGCADSNIRVFDIRNGQLLRTMSLGGGPAGGPREILVWTVKCLPCGHVVSGDSTGEIRFWDGKNYSLMQRIKSHRADVLDVEASADGETVISGGADRRSIIYRRAGNTKDGQRLRWAEVAHRRFHSHDVKTMAVFETKNLSIVVSGGLDTTPIIVPLREFGKEDHRTISSLPQSPAVQSCPSKRLIMSWWNREVSIWRIMGSSTLRPGHGGDYSDGIGPKKKKLVAKIGISGEENITSASLSANGNLLVVSTISEVKMFRMKSQNPHEDFRVHKLENPRNLATLGAKMVQVSPDAKWVLIVTSDNKILLIRLVEGLERRPKLLPNLITLRRLKRDTYERSKPGLHGNLGNYDRSITRVAFSADSKVLVVGDLSGYLDSWVLEGYEDVTLGAQLTQEREESSDEDQEEEEEEEEEKHPAIIFGQHWICNPSGSLLPKLPSAPLILSFRPSNSSRALSQVNGIHPTRHNPHPHSHDLPSGEDRLFALTCEHQFYEFSILRGKLSDWSRRNPTQNLPSEFRGLRDRGMGCIWDLKGLKERLWLYGSGWLWMFDLAQDLPPKDVTTKMGEDHVTDPTGKKRKRAGGNAEEENLRMHTSGAGSKIPNKRLRTGLGRKIRRIVGSEPSEHSWISSDGAREPESDDEDLDGDGDSSLSRLRRSLGDGVQTNGTADDAGVEGPQPVTNGLSLMPKQDPGKSAPCWHTYKYRPIMGILPIGGTDYDGDGAAHDGDVDVDEPRGLEVALVERPMWDVDLPPRYYGDQEWTK
ncbi:MAG: U3 small nucleolar RNA-associated protein [Pycnora praestabilis]|nr:MAG: U3 small nucleolar RNA-associated protein [Pycnora praestabilis]